MNPVSSFIIPLQQQKKSNSEDLKEKMHIGERWRELLYCLFPLYKHSKLLQVTWAHSHLTMAFIYDTGVLRDKICDKTKILFDDAFLRVPYNQWQHLSLSSLHFQKRVQFEPQALWSSWWVTAVNKHFFWQTAVLWRAGIIMPMPKSRGLTGRWR